MPADKGFVKNRGFLAWTRWVLGWFVAISAGLFAGGWWISQPVTPDAFYRASIPASASPGTLLTSEPFTRDVPASAQAWRILYVTTRGDGAAAVASGIVMMSRAAPVGAPPILAWAHGTTGVAEGCAPSLLKHPFAQVPALEAALAEGWVFVATDYLGLGTAGPHAYLVGEDAARGVLDSVRAARQLEGVSPGTAVVVWGHSQGGNSALWTGMRASVYAPEIAIAGVAALAPASDLVALVRQTQATMFGKIVSAYVTHAYAARYADVKVADYVGWWTRRVAGDIAGRCAGGLETLFSVMETALVPSGGIFSADPTAGALGARLAENSPLGPIPAPLLIAQGAADDLVFPAVQDAYVKRLCAGGQAVDFRSYAGRDHLSLVAEGSPANAELLAWTRARFAGEKASGGCGFG